MAATTRNKLKGNKTMIGYASLACAVLAIVLGFAIRKPFIDVISVGFLFSFVSMILSLASVQDTGKNRIPMLAFWLGFLSMWITVYLGASA